MSWIGDVRVYSVGADGAIEILNRDHTLENARGDEIPRDAGNETIKNLRTMYVRCIEPHSRSEPEAVCAQLREVESIVLAPDACHRNLASAARSFEEFMAELAVVPTVRMRVRT